VLGAVRETTGKSAGRRPAVRKAKASHGLTSKEVSYIMTQARTAFAFFAPAFADSCSSSARFRSTPQR